jgi:hypothetical protein
VSRLSLPVCVTQRHSQGVHPQTLLSHDEAVALTATGEPRNAVRLAFPDADDTFADHALYAHTNYPLTLSVHDLLDEIAAAVPVIAADLVTVDCDGLIASWHPETGFTGN